MKIELCEDNGFINDGVPTLVILVVTDDEGKQRRVPYQADRTIQQLYQDVQKMNNVPRETLFNPKDNAYEILSKDPEFSTAVQKQDNEIIKHFTIERNDTVKCIKVLERDPGSDCDLVLGEEYSILDIVKKNGVVIQYDIISETAPNRIRIPVFPQEIELSRKFIPPPPRKTFFETTMKCSHCLEVNVLILNQDSARYEGECVKCQAKLIQQQKLIQKEN